MTTPHHDNDLDPARATPEYEFWVRGSDNLHSTAAELMGMILDPNYAPKYIDLCCIGAGAVNAAAKITVIIREKLEHRIGKVVLQPFFSRVLVDGELRNRLVFRLQW